MIRNAIQRAYKVMHERNWDTIYWAIDLHGVCLESNYEKSKHVFISETVLKGLQSISNRPESRIILWSSLYPKEQKEVLKLFWENDILVYGFNSNPLESSTMTGDFSSKFYFSVLLDDKAGFDPNRDWDEILKFFEELDNENK